MAKRPKPDQLRKAIKEEAGNKIFSVVFTKRTNGEERKMTCKLHVKKGLTGAGQSYDPAEKGLLTVYDMSKRAYRNIDLESISKIKVNGEVTEFE